MPSLAAATSGETRAFSSSSVFGVYISQQCVQSFRASRCASTAETAEPVRKGSTPISFRRVIAPGPSFVCIVDSTRWPVRAASIEILAVSLSRISPTMTTSGSERRIERRVERRRLARARRAGREDRAGGPADDLLHLHTHLVGEAEVGQRGRLLRLVEQAHHDRLALDGGERGDADVEHPAGGGGVQRDAAVLRLAALGDIELRQHLQASRHSGNHPARNPLYLVQDAVDPQPDHQRLLLRLEVDVAGAVLRRLEDDRVDKSDERDVGDAVVDLEIVDLLLFLAEKRIALVDRGPGPEGLRLAGKPAKLGEDVVSGGYREVELP